MTSELKNEVNAHIMTGRNLERLGKFELAAAAFRAAAELSGDPILRRWAWEMEAKANNFA